MRMITSGGCLKGEYLVVWSVVGPPGAKGAQGPAGSQGPVGAEGPTGPQGPVGPPDGSTVLSGQGQPAADVGKTGDFYVDLQTWSMWGPKSGDTWSLGTTLIGPPGAQGPRGGSGPPGPVGATGSAGPQGPAGSQGPQGIPGPQGVPGGFGAYGSFADLGTQTNTSPGSALPIYLRETNLSSGVRIVDDTQITVDDSGIYNIAFSAQITKTDSGTDTVYLWLRVNGSDVPDSNTGVVLVGGGAKQVAAWNFFVSLEAGQNATLMWASLDANARILYEDDTATPYRPGIPSMIVTVNQVG